MKLFKNWTKAELQRYDRAHAEVQLCHSYRLLARAITELTGHSLHVQTLRRRMIDRTVDPRLAVAIAKLTGVSAFDLCPWLRPLIDELKEMKEAA